MTIETDLLPMPEGYDKYSPPRLYDGQMFHGGQMRAYALRVAKGFPEATPSVRALLDRWATGKQNGLSDRTDLCTFALQIYMSDLAREDEA